MKARLFATFLVLTCGLHAERPENELPMYGGQHDPKICQNKAWSESAAKLGWQYFYKGDLDTAIKRFNQAWMFDRESVDAFWGFGVIMGRRARKEDPEKNLKESIRCLEMAIAKAPKNARILVDLAESRRGVGAMLEGAGKDGKREFERAAELYEKAVKLEPDYPLLHHNWAVLEFYRSRYDEAVRHLDRAKQLGCSDDPSFERELREKANK